MDFKTSILGYNYKQKEFDERLAKTIYQRFELPEVVSNLLASRDILIEEVDSFLDPKIKTSLPDPFLLSDMDKGVDFVVGAIKGCKKVTIFADYDVDGATSAAILKRFLLDVGADVDIYIPDRILEGYGPNEAALLKLKEQGTDLVITLDCGTVAFEPLEAAKKAGLDVIVIDHHIGVLKKPDAIAVINPNNYGEEFEHKNLCAAGVTFLFVVAINKVLREGGFYDGLDPAPNRLRSSTLPQGEGDRLGVFRKRMKELRVNQTDSEAILWYYLRNKYIDGYKFRRQHRILDYIVDFVCLEEKLIIELDGDQHGKDKGKKYDEKRDKEIKKQGFRILRFWNDEVFKHCDNVLDEVYKNLNCTQTNHPPLVGGSKSDSDSGRGQISEPKLLNLLDLVALGTVCDVMSLTGLNRAFVTAGLKILKQRKNLGLRVLAEKAGLDEEPSSYHLGFVLGPRINAGGRVGTSNLGAELLSTNDESKAYEIAEKLEQFNVERKDIEKLALDEAKEMLLKGQDGFSGDDKVIFAVGKTWHQGVIGIVASRLKDLYEKPVAVITVDENGKGKASCRSISGIDFGAEILNARAEGLIIEGGGHAMAGGFSVSEDKIKDLHQYFNKKLSQKVEELSAKKEKIFDIALDLSQVNLDLLKEINRLEPFGVANQKPKFILRDVKKLNARIIGKTGEHVSATFGAKTAVGFDNVIGVVAFKCSENEIGQTLLDNNNKKPVSLVGTLNINSWMGNDKVQMIVDDIIK